VRNLRSKGETMLGAVWTIGLVIAVTCFGLIALAEYSTSLSLSLSGSHHRRLAGGSTLLALTCLFYLIRG
jgi:UPF0716 family protein affecting phage T7 exclusion